MAKQQNNLHSTTNKTPPRIRPRMRREAIHPADYNAYAMPYSCEQCSHFASASATCTFGLNPIPHLALTQKKSYELSGHMALCRFQEID